MRSMRVARWMCAGLAGLALLQTACEGQAILGDLAGSIVPLLIQAVLSAVLGGIGT